MVRPRAAGQAPTAMNFGSGYAVNSLFDHLVGAQRRMGPLCWARVGGIANQACAGMPPWGAICEVGRPT